MDTMGWLFSDYNNSRRHQSNIDAQFVTNAAAEKSKKTGSEIQILRTAVDKLILINRALWEIIAESQGLTEEYLLDKVNEIDLRDGVRDGKMREPLRKCDSCGRVLQQGYVKCIYCGTKYEGANLFHNINTESRDDMAQGLI
ncbi:MAG: hypothetical protein WC333_05710 [Dehalococcoidia bacterium]|jgi:hypothetical protein